MNIADKQSQLEDLANKVEAEMKKLRLWNKDLNFIPKTNQAFGADSLTFEEWLQSVFLPNLRRAAVDNTFPNRSNIAVAAIRNLDGLENTESLIQLLSKIDDLINR
jgi:uncharacterized protein YqcC (DUF446 family)